MNMKSKHVFPVMLGRYTKSRIRIKLVKLDSASLRPTIAEHS